MFRTLYGLDQPLPVHRHRPPGLRRGAPRGRQLPPGRDRDRRAFVAGSVIGVAAGYVGGWFDTLAMRPARHARCLRAHGVELA